MLPTIEEEATIPFTNKIQDVENLAISVLVSSFRARPRGQEGEWKLFAVGSRAMTRAFGLWGPNAYRRLPLKVRFRVLSSGESATVLCIQFSNDEGLYAFRLPTVEPAYRHAYREIVEKLESTLR